MARVIKKHVTLGQTFGNWTVISEDVRRTANSSVLVHVKCTCGSEKHAQLSHLRAGQSKSCEACGSRRRVETLGMFLADTRAKRQLRNRINVMISRCTNPKHKEYSYYGGRGIEFRFASVKDCAEYLLRLFPLENYDGLEIDRIDNDRHYEWGNLRLCDKATNMRNTRRSRRWESPFSETHTWRLLRKGLTPQEIIDRAKHMEVT